MNAYKLVRLTATDRAVVEPLQYAAENCTNPTEIAEALDCLKGQYMVVYLGYGDVGVYARNPGNPELAASRVAVLVAV